MFFAFLTIFLVLRDLFVIICRFNSKCNVSLNFRLILCEEKVEFSRECKLIRFYFVRWRDSSGADELTYKINLSN